MSSGSQWSDDERRQLALVLEQNVAAVLTALGTASVDDDGARPPLAVLLAACTAGDAVDDATTFAVAQARAAGHTWHEIGDVLAITRQAAQQRFSERTSAADRYRNTALATRANEIVEQIARADWEAVTADWNALMRAELSVERLENVWRQLTSTAGALRGVGRPTVKQKGPYRIAEVPLVFDHGPMRARVTFDHDDMVAGLFVLLPDAPESGEAFPAPA